MSLVARLHLPDGAHDLAVDAGEVREIPAAVVPALVTRADPRDRVLVDGRRVDRRGTAGRVRAGLALVTDAAVAPDVPVLDHLAAATSVRRARELLASSPLLRGRDGDAAGVLSGGERRVLALLRARSVGARAVVLDAPGEGLDAAALAWVEELLGEWRADGAAVLLRVGRPEERAWLGS